MVDFGNLPALEFLTMRGVQWCWDAICKMLKMASGLDILRDTIRHPSKRLLPYEFVRVFHF